MVYLAVNLLITPKICSLQNTSYVFVGSVQETSREVKVRPFSFMICLMMCNEFLLGIVEIYTRSIIFEGGEANTDQREVVTSLISKNKIQSSKSLSIGRVCEACKIITECTNISKTFFLLPIFLFVRKREKGGTYNFYYSGL